MLEDKHQGKNFLIGTIVGGLAATAAALLLAPKSGFDLRQDISDKYSQISDSIDLESLISSLSSSEEPKKSNTGLILGGIAGSVLGGVAAFLLATKSGQEISKNLTKKCRELSENDYAKQICDLYSFQKPAKRKRLFGARRK
jgi:gas vesicle protein